MTTKTLTMKTNLHLALMFLTKKDPPVIVSLNYSEINSALLHSGSPAPIPQQWVLHFTSEESRHKRIKIGRGRKKKKNHIGMTGREVGCFYFFSKHLILYCNNSVMSKTCHRMASSMPGILLWTVAFTWWEFLKILSEVTSLPKK